MHPRDREKLLRPTPTKRKRCFALKSMRSRSDRAMVVSSSQEEGGASGVWLRVRILNSLVFSLRARVRAIRSSLRDAVQVFFRETTDHRLGLGQGVTKTSAKLSGFATAFRFWIRDLCAC